MSVSRSPRARRARASVGALVAAAALLVGACSSGSGETNSGTAPSGDAADYGDVSLQLTWIKNYEFAGEYMADSEGFFKDAGFSSVELVAGPSTGVAELLSGKAFIALNDAIAAGTAIASDEGAPIKIVGATYQKNPFTIVSLKDGGDIATAEDMIGKKIGVQDSNLALFQALLAANDIDESELTIVPVQYDPSVLVNGEVDGFLGYLTNENLTVQRMGHEVTNLAFADAGLPFVAETFSVTDETLANDRDKVKAFLLAEIKGWKAALEDPAKAVDLTLSTYGADQNLDRDQELAAMDEQAKLVSTADTDANGLFTISDDLKAQTIETLANAGVTITPEQLFDTSLLDEIYAENPDLK